MNQTNLFGNFHKYISSNYLANRQKNIWLGVTLLYILLAFLATLQAHLTTHLEDGRNLTNYNNYLIFRQSYFHLANHQDLYLKYKYEYWDVFKYTPTFSLFMMPFAFLPTIPGLLIWNIVNVIFVIIGLNQITSLDARKKWIILVVSLIEIITAMQNEQSNGLVTGFLICAIALAEKRKHFFSIGLIVFVAYLKLLGIAALVMFVFYPKFWRSVLYSIFWMLFFLVLPLVVISPLELMHLYSRWLDILADDVGGTGGISMIRLIRSISGLNINQMAIQFFGMIVLCAPLLFWKRFENVQQRLLFLSSLLIWIVIFNHKAESPSYVIAVIGVAIWYVISGGGLLNTSLLIFCFIFTELSATDLFPEYLQTGFFTVYAIKAIPCILIWIKSNVDLWKLLAKKNPTINFSH